MSKRLGFFFNMNTCIGCGSCQVACKDHHQLLPGEYIRRAGMQAVQSKGGELLAPFSGSCNHCQRPACAGVCPTGAMYQEEDGIVLHRDALCIGCGRCYWACPYGQVSFSISRGMTQKCDTCINRRREGNVTACVAACPTASLAFGEVEAFEGGELALSFLPDPKITQPSTRLRKAKALEESHE